MMYTDGKYYGACGQLRAPIGVGSAATLCHPNDMYAGRITWVSRYGRNVTFVLDGTKEPRHFSLRHNDKYVSAGDPIRHGTTLAIGGAINYTNPDN